jgi:hypothetical protein
MGHVHVEAHADGVGGDEVIDLAGLVHGDLGVAGAGRERAHHHGGAAAHPAQHLGYGINLLGREGDDGGARRQAGELGRTGIAQGRETRPPDDLGLRQQRAHHRRERFGAEDHGFLAAADVEHAIREDVAALGVGAELSLVERDKGEIAFHRHRFGRAQEPARIGRQDLLLAGDQGDLARALELHHPVVDLAREQAAGESRSCRSNAPPCVPPRDASCRCWSARESR